MNINPLKTVIITMWVIMHIACLNSNGLRDLKKFERVKRLLKADVLCLQETHWTGDIMDNIKKRWEGEIYVSHGNVKACGVAILIKRDRVQNVKQIYKDGSGRLLGLEFMFCNELFRLINIYAPNIEFDRKEVFNEMKTYVKENV